VEGLLTTGCFAVVYGDSNVGKSFWVIDLLLHIAGGIPWNGREVDQGIAIMISLEGGGMTDNRIIAARNRLGLPSTVPLVLVQCPLDLRTSAADADRLINTIVRVVSECTGPVPVRIVAIDTLSRALNGGSEDAEALGALIANADYIRYQVNQRIEQRVAILFVAHCGKDAAKGIRGWSGTRAALDVEIEITRLDDAAGFVAEVTKERDLPTGDRFAFMLDPIVMGRNRRGKEVSTCVVVPTDVPRKQTGKPARELTARHAACRDHLRALMAAHGAAITPEPGMPAVTGMLEKAFGRG
jgi:hypothetical protein